MRFVRGEVNAPLTNALLVLLPLTWLISLLFPVGMSAALSMNPSNTIGLLHFRFWTPITSIVLEQHFVNLVVSLVAVHFWVRSLEEKAGTSLVVTMMLASSFLNVAVITIISALAFPVGFFWLYQSYNGFLPCAACCTVALARITGGSDYAVSATFLNAIRLKHLPFNIVLVALALDVARRVTMPADDFMTEIDIGNTNEVFEGPQALATIAGAFFTWLIIRFDGLHRIMLQRSTGSSSFGSPDSSPGFALHEFFFPFPLRMGVLIVSTVCFRVARTIGIGRDIEVAQQNFVDPEEARKAAQDNARASAVSMMTAVAPPLDDAPTFSLAPLPGSSTADADRRRAVALAALTARLQQAQTKQSKVSVQIDEEQQSDVAQAAETTVTIEAEGERSEKVA